MTSAVIGTSYECVSCITEPTYRDQMCLGVIITLLSTLNMFNHDIYNHGICYCIISLIYVDAQLLYRKNVDI